MEISKFDLFHLTINLVGAVSETENRVETAKMFILSASHPQLKRGKLINKPEDIFHFFCPRNDVWIRIRFQQIASTNSRCLLPLHTVW